MTDRELLQQALLCLEGWENTLDEDCGEPDCDECKPFRRTRKAITALRERLAQPEPPCKTGASCVGGKCPRCEEQPEQEPVAVVTGKWIERNTVEELERFAALVAAAEREACARVCDEFAAKDTLSNYYAVAARAIRARGALDELAKIDREIGL